MAGLGGTTIRFEAFLLIAGALSAAPRPRAVAGCVLMGALSVFGCAHLLVDGGATAPAHREALARVIDRARPGDAIVHSTTVTYHAVHEYYLPRADSRLLDYLIEPQGEFRAGRLGRMFRNVWRAIRTKADPGGVLKTGRDPHRIGEGEFLGRGYRRVWYFNTTRPGKRWMFRHS